MNEIEEQAINTYNNNITYLLQEHPSLAKDLENLDLAINNGIHKQQFDLEYVNNNFDIKDLNSGLYMYSKEGNSFAEETVTRINFKKKLGTIEGFSIYDPSKLNIENIEILEEKKDVYTLMKYYIDNVSTTETMKKIRKFIFIGVGLGLHITLIDKKVNATDYLIVEDNLEIFKLSLFTTPYYLIAKNSRVTFSILEDKINFTKKFDTFLNNNFAYNRYLKYIRLNNHSSEKIRLIQSAIANQNFIVFAYKRRLEMNLKPLTYLNDGYKFLDLHQAISNNFFVDKPILLLAAGPSFKKNIQWIKENHGKFIIIAVAAILKTLHAHNIKPDIVTHIDNAEKNYVFFDDININEYLKDTIFILSAMVPEKIINMLPKEQIYLFENLTSYNNNYKVETTDCVGSFSLLLSLLLSTNNTYLLGLDLALNQETGATHADEHSKNQNIKISKANNIATTTSLIDTTLPVEGNLQDIVYTNPLLHASIKTLNRLIPQIIAKDQTIYNLGDGAKLSHSLALDIDNLSASSIKDINKSTVNSSLHDIFKNSSSKNLSLLDIKLLKLELNASITIKTHIDEFKNIPLPKDADKYIGNLIDLLIKILIQGDKDSFALSEVYYDYFSYALAIVEDFFNTTGSKNTKQHLKKFNKMISIGLYDIQECYEKALESFIESRKL